MKKYAVRWAMPGSDWAIKNGFGEVGCFVVASGIKAVSVHADEEEAYKAVPENGKIDREFDLRCMRANSREILERRIYSIKKQIGSLKQDLQAVQDKLKDIDSCLMP